MAWIYHHTTGDRLRFALLEDLKQYIIDLKTLPLTDRKEGIVNGKPYGYPGILIYIQ
jgi:hypothetical protein